MVIQQMPTRVYARKAGLAVRCPVSPVGRQVQAGVSAYGRDWRPISIFINPASQPGTLGRQPRPVDINIPKYRRHRQTARRARRPPRGIQAAAASGGRRGTSAHSRGPLPRAAVTPVTHTQGPPLARRRPEPHFAPGTAVSGSGLLYGPPRTADTQGRRAASPPYRFLSYA